MATDTFTVANDWKDYEAEDVDAASDTFVVALSNTAPASETPNPLTDGNGTLTNVTQISYTNLSARTLTTASSSQTSGTYSLVFNDITLTASGGSVAAFRYIYIYDDTVAGDPIVGYLDYGSELTLADGDSITIDFGANGIYTKA